MSTIALAELASGQWGLVTTAQAGGVRVSPQALARLAHAGALERLAHGAYRLTGTPSSPHDDLRAAWLLLDPRRTAGERLDNSAPEVVSHRSAAWVRELGDLDADRHEFTVSRRRQSRRHDVRFHRGVVGPEEWSLVSGLPVTTAARTILDLATSRLDGGHLGGVVRDALLSQQADADQVVRLLRPFAHHYGAPLGDGQALVEQFLAEAGVPETAVRTAELAEARRTAERTAQAYLLGDPEFGRAIAKLAGLQNTPEVQRTLAQIARLRSDAAVAQEAEQSVLASRPAEPGQSDQATELDDPDEQDQENR